MPLFLQISKHSPESCPMHNEKTKKALTDLTAKMDKLTKKHGIKMVGSWVSMPEHLMVTLYDAPSMEALMKASMEPEAMAWSVWNTAQTMPVATIEEVMKLLSK